MLKVLLRSDKGVSNFSDRSLLKNLGHWLGMLTLAKNCPILHDVSYGLSKHHFPSILSNGYCWNLNIVKFILH